LFNVGDRVKTWKDDFAFLEHEGTIVDIVREATYPYRVLMDGEEDPMWKKGRYRIRSELFPATPAGPEVYEEWFK